MSKKPLVLIFYDNTNLSNIFMYFSDINYLQKVNKPNNFYFL